MGAPEARAKRFQRLVMVRERGRDVVAMELAQDLRIEPELLAAWQSLPPFPYLLECLGGGTDPLLRFAAIDWNAERIKLTSPAIQLAATAGVALTRAFELIAICVPVLRWRWFTCPFVVLDLDHRPRAGFLTPRGGANRRRLPPEVEASWPACDERAFVYAVGQLVLDLVDMQPTDLGAPLATVIRRAMHSDPLQRYSTLAVLRRAFIEAGGRRTTRDSPTSGGAWDHVESGIGFLQARKWALAREAFGRALAIDWDNSRARRGMAIVDIRDPGMRSSYVRGEGPSSHTESVEWFEAALRGPAPRSWADIEPLARKLEAEHDPRAALSLYRSVNPEPDNRVNLGIARTSLALGDTGHAIDYARRARASDPSSLESIRIEALALLRRRQHAEALACTDAWAAVAPDDGPLHYARGKALLGLSRLPEARDAFDRAIVLEPTMIEAMLLRCEVDRHMKKQRGAVGAQAQAALEFPPELAGFRDAMASGHVVEAIALLRTARYADDALAQILLAQLLAFDGENTEALAMFLRFVDGEHRRSALIGAAECCLALGHSEEALAAANRLDPRKEVVAIELRARAFAQLGRDAEAEAELQRFVAANRGDVRVRNARR